MKAQIKNGVFAGKKVSTARPLGKARGTFWMIDAPIAMKKKEIPARMRYHIVVGRGLCSFSSGGVNVLLAIIAPSIANASHGISG